jgi:protein-glutamine gamma-glutamyltransferase
VTTVAATPRALPNTALRPASVLVPFVLFCTYAMLRWQTTLPHMGWRPAAMLALGFVIAVAFGNPTRLAARWPAMQNRILQTTLAVVVIVIAVILLLLIAGMPAEWVFRARIALMVRTLADGIAALPVVNVPYHGGHRDVRVMITLCAGLLVLAAALTLRGVLVEESGMQTRSRQRRLITAAALLLVMALVPSIVVQPHYVLLHGTIAFALTVLLVYGWRIEKGRGLGALVLLTVTAACAATLAGSLSPRHGLLDVNQIVTSLGSTKPAAFNWQQTYGPLGRAGGSEIVLDVRAAHAAHWKAENLDVFNGIRWIEDLSPAITGIQPMNPLLDVSGHNRKRWTQTLHVTDVDIGTEEVIAAGSAEPPLIDRTIPGVMEGTSAGTWSLDAPLRPGQTYSVSVYTPTPTAAQLNRTKAHYPRAIRDSELGVALPHHAVNPALYPVQALARSLKAGTTNPYQYVEAVNRYLHHGFTYVRNPPRSVQPIPTFLLHTKRGYCQQFAGAMALLLRMGGVPARVAVGFATGSLDRATHTFTVRAREAHAWVEVWFPHYGWVTFDPTPAQPNVAGTALTGQQSGKLHGDQSIRGSKFPNKNAPAPRLTRPGQATHQRAQAASSGISATVIVISAAVLLIVLAAAARLLRKPRAIVQSPGQLTRELERAFARCGRPLKQEVTLAQLAGSLQSANPEAAAYVRSVRLARFAPGALPPTSAQRRALRGWLARGRGVRGRLKALLALPPSR